MGSKIKTIAFILGLLFFGIVLRCIKQNTFRPRYAVLWLVMSLFLLSISALEPFYKWIATSLLGIVDARHIIYVGLIGFLLIYNLYLTAMASRMANQIQHLISSVALLEEKAAAAASGGLPAADPSGASPNAQLMRPSAEKAPKTSPV